jgi:hypothetical protein
VETPRRQCPGGGLADDARGVAIQRIVLPVVGICLEACEERPPPSPTTTAPPAPGSRRSSRRSSPAPIEASLAHRQDDVQPDVAPAPRAIAPALNAMPTSTQGDGVVERQAGGRRELGGLTALSTQVPEGVPANLPVTVAALTRPLGATVSFTIARPGTLYWL